MVPFPKEEFLLPLQVFQQQDMEEFISIQLRILIKFLKMVELILI